MLQRLLQARGMAAAAAAQAGPIATSMRLKLQVCRHACSMPARGAGHGSSNA